MDWLDDLEQKENAIEDAVIVVSELPQALTQRQIKAKKGVVDPWKKAVRDHTLQAYPELYPNETEDSRLERAAAFETVWSIIESRIKSCLDSTDAAVFSSLLELARQSHPGDGIPPTVFPHGLHRIPTGLVLAGGVNSADHVRTFPHLAAQFRREGCYVALLQLQDFSGPLSGTLNSVLRQMSGLSDTRADAFAALAAWYSDEIGSTGGIAQAARPPLPTPLDVDRADEQDEGDEVQGRRTGRSRPPVPSVAAADVQRQQRVSNRHRPLVVVVESAEAVPEGTLADLVSVLSEGWPQLPVCLVLGLTTTDAALRALLPPSLIDRALDCHLFNLATAVARLDILVQDVLLAPWPGLLLDASLVACLWEHFLMHYFSPGIVIEGWKQAAGAHFKKQPLAAFAAAAVSGNVAAAKAACADLPPAALKEANRILGARVAAKDGSAVLEDAVREVLVGWRDWALAVRCMAAAAEAAGLKSGYTPWQLYRDALLPGFAHDPTGKEILGRLDRSLRRMNDETANTLVERISKLIHDAPEATVEDEEKEESRSLAELRNGLEELRLKLSDQNDKANAAAEDNAPREDRDDEAGKEGNAAAAAPEPAAAAAATKKHERYHSQQSRREALLSKSRSQAAKAGKASAGKAAAAPPKSHGVCVAEWLCSWLTRALKQPPTELPAAAIFTCSDVDSLECLSAAPREAVHAQLTQPHLYLPLGAAGAVVDDGAPSTSAAAAAAVMNKGGDIGISTRVDDVCLAYQLFDQDPSCSNVADWFTAFRIVHEGNGEESEHEDAEEEAEDGDGNSSPLKKKGRGGSSSKATAKAGGKRKTSQQCPGGKKKKGEGNDPVQQRELAARFSQASSELQFMGLIKPVKRRARGRGDAVERAVHMPAPLMGDI